MDTDRPVGTLDDLPAVDNSRFVPGSTKKLVFGPERFWPEQSMRCFTLSPKAYGPPHRHPWAHYVFVHRGKGVFEIDGTEYAIGPSSWVHVPAMVSHSFWNSSEKEELVFLCIVPPAGDINPLTWKPQPTL